MVDLPDVKKSKEEAREDHEAEDKKGDYLAMLRDENAESSEGFLKEPIIKFEIDQTAGKDSSEFNQGSIVVRLLLGNGGESVEETSTMPRRNVEKLSFEPSVDLNGHADRPQISGILDPLLVGIFPRHEFEKPEIQVPGILFQKRNSRRVPVESC